MFLGTESLQLWCGDVDADGDVDLLLGSYDQTNMLLTNDGWGSFNIASELPGGSYDTRAILAADLNSDGVRGHAPERSVPDSSL